MEKQADDFAIDPSLVKVSFGDLPLSDAMMVTIAEPGQLRFTWNSAIPQGASSRDQVMMLAYNVKNQKAFSITNGQCRYTGTDLLPINAAPGATFHLYAAFIAEDRSRQSHSVYLGEISI